MNKLTIKIILSAIIILAILAGLYRYSINKYRQPVQKTSKQTNASTTTEAQNKTSVTPQQLGRQDLLKAGVRYQDIELGYEFIAPGDVSYFKTSDQPDIRTIALIDDTGSNPKWLTISIIPFSVPYSNVIPTNLNLLSDVKSYLLPRPYTKIVKCNFNNIPCIRVYFKDNPPPSDDIFFIIKNQLMTISLSNSNPQGGNSQPVNAQAAQDYYQKFLSTFKILPESKK